MSAYEELRLRAFVQEIARLRALVEELDDPDHIKEIKMENAELRAEIKRLAGLQDYWHRMHDAVNEERERLRAENIDWAQRNLKEVRGEVGDAVNPKLCAEIEQLRASNAWPPLRRRGNERRSHYQCWDEAVDEIERLLKRLKDYQIAHESVANDNERLEASNVELLALLAEGIECRGNASSDDAWAKRARAAIAKVEG
jgi:predicted  nucleic acid-binding Zn-ribbon protein